MLFDSSLSLTLILLIFLPTILTIPMVDQQQQHRFRRGVINFLSDVNEPEIIADHGSSINLGGNTGDPNGKNTRDPWLHMVKHQTGRVMQGGTDLVLTPINWFTNLINNWYLKEKTISFIFIYNSFFFVYF